MCEEILEEERAKEQKREQKRQKRKKKKAKSNPLFDKDEEGASRCEVGSLVLFLQCKSFVMLLI